MSYILGQFNQPKVDYTPVSQISTERYMQLLVNDIKATTLGTSMDVGVIGQDGNATFYNECLSYDSKFKSDSHYYLHAKIKRLSTTQQFDIYLFNEDQASSDSQFIKSITVRQGAETEWVDLELTFTPAKNFQKLVFQLRRISFDYRPDGEQDLPTGRRSLIVYEELSSIKSIVPSLVEGKNLLKIGVQSHPGLMMFINDDEIHIGRSGVYELRNGIVPVNFFSVINTAIEDTTKFPSIAQGREDCYSMEEYLEDLVKYDKTHPVTDSSTNSKCILGHGKLRALDAFTLDYMYEEGN